MKDIEPTAKEYEKATMDGGLMLERRRYVAGYSSRCRGNDVIHIEHRIGKTHYCTKDKKGCRSRWYGFARDHIGPLAIYDCKHGRFEFHLVHEIKGFV